MAVALLIPAILLLFLPPVWPFSFTPHCSLPDENVNYVSGPNIRSTLEIFWSSVVTIFLCTWTVLHLNIPEEPEESQYSASNHGTSHYLGVLWKWHSRKPKWMLATILLPEFLVGKSLAEFVAAWRSANCEVMRRSAEAVGIEWTMTHAFYANMGGFILIDGSKWCHGCRSLIMTRSQSTKARIESNFETCCHFINNDTISTRTPREPPNHSDSNSIEMRNLGSSQSSDDDDWRDCGWQLPNAVNTEDLRKLLERGAIERLPSITKDQINRQSKEDVIVKVLTLFQVLWLFTQLITRKARGLPSSQLEIATLSYAICTFMTYLFWLLKPKDLVSATEILAVRELNPADRIFLNRSPKQGFFQIVLLNDYDWSFSLTIPNDTYNSEAALGRISGYDSGGFCFNTEDIGFIIGAVVFGSTHLIAWNFQFPTPLEQKLWRVTSLVTVGIIPLWYIFWVPLDVCGRWMINMNEPVRVKLIKIAQGLRAGCALTVYIIYGLCRIFIIAECFRGLFYLPPDAFKGTWTAVLPRFS